MQIISLVNVLPGVAGRCPKGGVPLFGITPFTRIHFVSEKYALLDFTVDRVSLKRYTEIE